MVSSRQSGPTPTLADVALAAGVSRATAARALGGYGAVSAAVRERVTEAATRLNYRANTVARSVRTGRTATIGCVVADMANPFFSQTTRGMSDAARRHGYEVIVVNTDESLPAEQRGLELLMDKRVDGIVVASTTTGPAPHLLAAQREGFPVVLLDRRVTGVTSDQVIADNRAGATTAMRVLVADGHRRIAFVSAAGPEKFGVGTDLSVITSSGADRIRAYLDVTAGLEADPALTGSLVRLAGFTAGAAYGAATELLDLPERPTAIFASDSVVGIEVLWAIRDAGLSVPRDISFVMGDDVPWALATNPASSAVAQPVYELGRRSAELLVRRIAEPTAPFETVVMATTFRRRDSIGPVPRAARRVRRAQSAGADMAVVGGSAMEPELR